MQVDYKILYLKKRFPLRISRGVRDGQHYLVVSVSDGNHTGWGETSPGVSDGAATAEEAQIHLERFLSYNQAILNSVHETYDEALANGLAP
ncbi:MAG: dipeptide epimerase, partial [Croceivirga sp.]